MRTQRILVLGLCLALCTLGTSLGWEDKAEKQVHKGVITGVDREAKVVNIKVKTEDSEVNHAYTVTDKTVIKDLAGKTITINELKVDMHVQVKSKKEGGKRIALEITEHQKKDKK